MRRALLSLCLVACGDSGTTTDATVDATIAETDDFADSAEVSGDSSDVVDSVAETDAADTDTTGPAAPWYQSAVMYEVFVRSFQDSDGDGIGDLRGLIDRLDYLNDGVPGSGDDLEIDGLWLMPIFEADSYHGYDVTDYRSIEKDYGTSADFDALIAACDARGIKVVLDLVMNHTGEHHPWFLDSRSGAGAAKRDWYVWRGDDPGWKQPFGTGSVWHPYGGSFYYGVFWSGMPDLNYREPAVVAEMTDVAQTWLARGAAGFRLDAAGFLVESVAGGLSDQPETHAFWKSLRAALPRATYLVGEVWESRTAVTSYWGDDTELHQAFDFDLELALRASAVQDRASWLVSELERQKAAGAPWSYEATFISNHDLARLSLTLDDGEERSAAFALLTLPGTPYIYYGDELAAKSAPKVGDEAKRGPMAWDADAKHGFTTGTPWLGFGAESDTRNVAVALASPTSLARYYQSLVRLRHAHPALAGGDVEVIATSEPGIFAMLRASGDEVLLVVANLGDTEVDFASLDGSAATGLLGSAPWTLTGIFGSTNDSRVTDAAVVPMGSRWAPHEGRIWKLGRLSQGGSP